MGTMIANDTDVVTFLKSQHKQVKATFERVIAARGDERSQAFVELRSMMAVHETAEEEIVHPAARKALPDGDAVVNARLHEENQAKHALAELESLDVNSSDFDTKIRALQANVLAHAQAEESEEFDRLASVLDPARLASMRKAVQVAEQFAPVRPHAGIESAAANRLVGPFAAMVDRARDAIAGKS